MQPEKVKCQLQETKGEVALATSELAAKLHVTIMMSVSAGLHGIRREMPHILSASPPFPLRIQVPPCRVEADGNGFEGGWNVVQGLLTRLPGFHRKILFELPLLL